MCENGVKLWKGFLKPSKVSIVDVFSKYDVCMLYGRWVILSGQMASCTETLSLANRKLLAHLQVYTRFICVCTDVSNQLKQHQCTATRNISFSAKQAWNILFSICCTFTYFWFYYMRNIYAISVQSVRMPAGNVLKRSLSGYHFHAN